MAEGEKSNETGWQFEPGQVVGPGGQTVSNEGPTPPAPVVSDSLPEQPLEPTEPEASYADPESATQLQSENSISWTASEFIAHEKSSQWYFLLGIAGLALAVVVFFLNHHDFISAGVVMLGVIVLGIYGARKPRELNYQITPQGLQIDQKYYGFDQFRSFSVVPEGAFSSIIFMPLKRFAPTISIYYAPQDEEQIVNVLSGSLPLTKPGFDAVDRLMRHIRF